RSLGRVSVPVCLVVLSDQGPVIGLVSRYPTNDLMGRRPLPARVTAFFPEGNVCGLSGPFGPLSPTPGQVTHVFLSRPPLSAPKGPASDLHALGTPPAFILSQDQTLRGSLARPSMWPMMHTLLVPHMLLVRCLSA